VSIKKISQYLALVRFSHTIFALPFAFIGFVLGYVEVRHRTDFLLSGFMLMLGKMLLCMVFARSAAMAFNRYLDRKFDAANPRTARREIPAGIISPSQALIFTIAMSAGFVITTYFINMLCFWLSFVALFVILFYSYTKRFTALCHLVLGVGLSLSPIGAYLTLTGKFSSLLPILFSATVFTWVAGFDIIYALQDEQFDRANNLHSIPAWLGVKKALNVSIALHVLSALVILAIGVYGNFNVMYWAGAVVYIGLLLYQHTLVKPTDLSKVNIAFANTNGLASVIFGIVTVAALLLS
jgi:4-hydroxybenzoate polyprenyltransferase